MRQAQIFLTLILVGPLLLFNPLSTEAACRKGQVDINSAALDELDQITGIGPVLAQRITEGRPFSDISELVRIKGIGEATLAKIASQGLACLRAKDDEAMSSQEMQQDRRKEQPPSVDGQPDLEIFINAPELGFSGKKVLLEAGISADDLTDKSIRWVLGDGAVAAGRSVQHAYRFPGHYLIRLFIETVPGREVSAEHKIEIVTEGILISEFLPSPKGDDAVEEWIELVNLTDQAVNLGGWQLDDAAGKGSKTFSIPSDTIILPKAFLVFARDVTRVVLNNTEGDAVRLLSPQGVAVDEVRYEEARDGYAAARRSDKFFWTDLPTPGSPNLIFDQKLIKETLGRTNDEGLKSVEAREKNTSRGAQDLNLLKVNVVEKSSGRSPPVPATQTMSISVANPTLLDLDDPSFIRDALAASKGMVLGEKILTSRRFRNPLFRSKIKQGTDAFLLKSLQLGKRSLGLLMISLGSAMLAFWLVITARGNKKYQ